MDVGLILAKPVEPRLLSCPCKSDLFTRPCHIIAQLSKLDLDMRFSSTCSPLKNFQDQSLPINYLHLTQACQIVYLSWLNRLVEYDDIRIGHFDNLFYFFCLPTTNPKSGFCYLTRGHSL